MPAMRWRGRNVRAATLVGLAVTLAAACGGDSDDEVAPVGAPATSSTTSGGIVLPTGVPPTTVAPPEGVQQFSVTPSHSTDPIVYPQTPPVGGAHSPTWQACAFYDGPVASEQAVHSLEHGAIWITYRPDLPEDQRQALRDLARRRADVLVSRWDVGLPAPVVASSWGRQLTFETGTDPRIEQFVRAFSGQAPEPNAPC